MAYVDQLLTDFAAGAVWKFNEASGTLADATGNGHTGTATGTVLYGASSIVPATTDTCIDLGDSLTGANAVAVTSILEGSSSFTAEGTVLIPTTGQLASTKKMILFGFSSSVPFAFSVINNVGVMVCGAADSVNGTILGTTALTPGTAYLLTYAVSAGTLTFYINGTADAGGTHALATGVSGVVNLGGGSDQSAGKMQLFGFLPSVASTAGQVSTRYGLWATSAGPQPIITQGGIGTPWGVQCAIVVTASAVPPDPGKGVWLIQEVTGNVNVAPGVRKVWPVTRGSIPNSFPPGVIPVEYVTVGSIPNAIPGVKQIIKVNQALAPV